MYNVLLVVSIRSLLSISLLPLSLHNVICPPSLLSSSTIPILPSSSFIPSLSGTPENVQAVLTAKALPLLIRGMDIPVPYHNYSQYYSFVEQVLIVKVYVFITVSSPVCLVVQKAST